MTKETRNKLVKILFFLGGILLLALGINLMATVSHFGLSPWDSLFIALRDNFGFTLGFWMFMLNGFFLVVVWFTKREYVSVTTVAIIFLISIFVDGLNALFAPFFISIPDVLSFVIGGFLIGYGIGMYVSASLGVAPQEGFMLAVSKKTKWSYRKTEILASLVVLLISFSLEGPIYYGTIILTIAVGYIIQFSIEQSKRLLTLILST